jgi:hypothetical protein
MDITVTTPLEMNVGQQKYVVAYTLKQGTEKQPDILNAQKSQDSIDSVHKMSSSSSSTAAKNAKTNDHQQHPTPPSHHGTLKYNDNGTKGYMALNQTIAGNYNAAQPPSYCSTMMNDFETPLNYTVNYNSTSGASNVSNASTSYHHHKLSPNEYNNLSNLYNHNNGSTNAAAAAAVTNSSNLHLGGNELLESSDGFLDFEKALLDGGGGGRYCTNNDDNNYKYTNDLSGGHHSQQQQQQQPQHSYASDSYIGNESVDYKNLANQIANTISNINSTLTRSRNRNHILTDNLPGPESCV